MYHIMHNEQILYVLITANDILDKISYIVVNKTINIT